MTNAKHEVFVSFDIGLGAPYVHQSLDLDLQAVANDEISHIPEHEDFGDINLSSSANDSLQQGDNFLFDDFHDHFFDQFWELPTPNNQGVFEHELDEPVQTVPAKGPTGASVKPDYGDTTIDKVNKQSHDSASTTPGKIGARFSSWSVGILRTWLSQHSHHPYPTARDMEKLQRQTGLSRQQISNWLANTRRRSKFGVSRPSALYVQSTNSVSMEIPKRRGSPACFEHMNPLQRWENSPPEQEAAPFSAIANAVSNFSSGTNSPYNTQITNDGPANSLYTGSSAGSVGTSNSSRSSLASAYSYNSRSSLRSSSHHLREVKHRRRRVANKLPDRNGPNALAQASHTFQCTFCTETFRTKHNWQRHEKSLHLSLERWECCPDGPVVVDADLRRTCVFCGQFYPDQDHLATHNSTACMQRLKEERTFYRKDHLQQHLKLVHDAKFTKWPMEKWKYESQEIRSRCGFCGLSMRSWSDRADHLAEHFKDGKTMVDWHGDWGFEDSVLDMVENSMPPYLIHHERNSPWPFTTTQGLPESPPSAFELIKVELEYFSAEYTNRNHSLPSNQELQYESCCIIFGSEMLSQGSAKPSLSWLRNLLMSSEEIANQARIRPMKSAAKSRITQLQINGKDNIFEECNAEAQLRGFVEVYKILGSGVGDEELQREVCNILDRMEATSSIPSKMFICFLTSLIWKSTHWLAPFRQGENLTPVETSSAPRLNDPPSPNIVQNVTPQALDITATSRNSQLTTSAEPGGIKGSTLAAVVVAGKDEKSAKPATPFFLDDHNCYRRVSRKLSRYVARTASTRNPDSHIPTDEELQYQARWIMFEDDDPWNQTPADNPNWLQQFKRDIGLSNDDPALNIEGLSLKN